MHAAQKEDTRPWGLILAGGAGRRAGGADKGLLPGPAGTPMVADIAGRLRPQVRRLFISCNRNRRQYAPHADQLLSDHLPGYPGPLAGLASFPWREYPGLLLVCPCDTPGIPHDLADQLARALEADANLQVAYMVTGTQPHYLHAMLHTAVLATLPEFMRDGGRAVRDWYAGLSCRALEAPAGEGLFENRNDPTQAPSAAITR